MIIYIASDHKGFKLKNLIKNFLIENGFIVEDLGNNIYDENDDYPDFAKKVSEKISLEPNNKGILICGSGVGMVIAANKFKNIRAGLIFDPNQAFDSRNDDDTNILVLPANFINENLALKITYIWINTNFSNETKHFRRINKILNFEEKNFK